MIARRVHYAREARDWPLCRRRWRHHIKNVPLWDERPRKVTCKACLKLLEKR